ncbi:hypothetical protein KCP78_11540 [Salmonella enterica subsp. enterica]|nr:hypothetical protein KCP78_11540 [Salmonella enterica subsp. enterica]
MHAISYVDGHTLAVKQCERPDCRETFERCLWGSNEHDCFFHGSVTALPATMRPWLSPLGC